MAVRLTRSRTRRANLPSKGSHTSLGSSSTGHQVRVWCRGWVSWLVFFQDTVMQADSLFLAPVGHTSGRTAAYTAAETMARSFTHNHTTGTGKTSALRALAAHTGRHVLTIPLNRIRTNGQLMSLMLDQKIRVSGCRRREWQYFKYKV